jgi:ATP-dependent helicase HrpB
MSRSLKPLPIDPLLPEVVGALKSAASVVLEAPPGAGKTTRVPPALLDLGAFGEIVVLEPRRLAARLSAKRVAEERGERLGDRVGYSVRFEDVTSSRTRLRYVTEGVLLRRLIDDSRLTGVGVVVLDEFHERHLATDLSLALLRRLQQRERTDLRLLVMSATIAAEAVARHLDGCPCLKSLGRSFPVQIEHQNLPDDRPLDKQVVSAVRQLLREEDSGDILVFLPGAGEIRRASEALSPLAAETRVQLLPLHGDLPLADQVRAVEPSDRRKVVLSTNVAESSVTIDGVTAVVDSGLARIATHSPWTGLPKLGLAKISRASAAQRAGRAGRTRPGRVLRLYTQGDFGSRPEYDTPELLRLDLSEALLLLHGAGVTDAVQLPWLDTPPAAALEAAETLLGHLGALDQGGGLSAIGQRLLGFPVHPRLARIIVEGERRGVAEDACLIAALLGERDIRIPARTQFGARGAGSQLDVTRGPSDLLELVDRFAEAEAGAFDPSLMRSAGLDARAVGAVDRARKKLRQKAQSAGDAWDTSTTAEQALLACVLAGFPDRVARRRRPGSRDLILRSGASAELGEHSVVHDAQLLVAVDIEERGARGKSGQTVVRLASAIEAEWLLDSHSELLESKTELEWNPGAERVESVSRVLCGSVVLDESRAPAAAGNEAAAVLARAAAAAGPARFGAEGFERLKNRIALLREHFPDADFKLDNGAGFGAALALACRDCVSFAELEGVDIAARLEASLGGREHELLRRQAPERITLPGGRSVEVHYEPGKPPWVESRLQDFFGMAETPRLCAGKVALTVHLLAPNQRAVQVTSDLAGFWERHYPQIRRELMRRYPRHAWPEDGRHAEPPKPGPRRPRA